MSSGSEVPEHLQRLLRLLTIGEETAVDQALHGLEPSRLDPKTSTLVMIAALVATEGDGTSYQSAIDRAHVAGASDDEIRGTLTAIGPLVGSARIASAISVVSLALSDGEVLPADPLRSGLD